MEKPKLYIAGPVSGMPDLNRESFAKATKTFRDLGYLVVNPLEICQDIPSDQWSKCMKVCINALMNCDVVILLSGWEKSLGACIENRIAKDLEMPAFSINDYLKTLGL